MSPHLLINKLDSEINSRNSLTNLSEQSALYVTPADYHY